MLYRYDAFEVIVPLGAEFLLRCQAAKIVGYLKNWPDLHEFRQKIAYSRLAVEVIVAQLKA